MESDTWAIVEEWRPVVDFEGLYEVSNIGRVRRVGKAHKAGKGYGGGARIGRIRKPQPMRGGYLQLAIYKEGKQYMRMVHTLVAAAFIGPCPDGMEVNHKHGTIKGHGADNLEYMTRAQNSQHAWDTGLSKMTPSIWAVFDKRPRKRQPRIQVPCECGCGICIETPDSKGRKRRFINGHQRVIRLQTC